MRHTVQYLVVVAAVVAHLAVFWPVRSGVVTADWDVIGCDVGQGDMFLVRTGPDSAMVIDTGPDPELAQDCLKRASVTRVDVLVITHLHADHVGGIQGVLDVVQPDQMIYSTGTDPALSATDLGMPGQAQQVTAPAVHIIDHARDDQDHPVELRWSILSANQRTTNENNASIVLFAEIYRHGGLATALFTGDLEEDEMTRLLAEQRIPGNVDILKLPHHGAKNGGTDLIEHTRPSIALVGVGADNTYGHPHEDILEALGPRTDIRRTDLHGTFSVSFQHSPAHVAAER